MNKIIKIILKTGLNKIWNLGSIINDPQNLVITGSPRGGTTWLLELLETIPTTRRMWEPFSEFPLDEITRRPYLSLKQNNQEFEDFLSDIFNGKKVIHPGISNLPYNKLKYLKDLLTAQNTLIKFTRAQRLLPYLSQKYNFKKILIMRHPLATIASQLYHPAFSEENNVHPVLSNYDFGITNLDNYIDGIHLFEKQLAVTWCYDYLVPLMQWKSCDNTLLITYENLVKNPIAELSRIEVFLDLKFPEKIYKKINIPSQTTVNDSNVKKDNRDPLTTWQKRLSEKQIENILEVLDVFEVDFYSRNLDADYEILRSKYGVEI